MRLVRFEFSSKVERASLSSLKRNDILSRHILAEYLVRMMLRNLDTSTADSWAFVEVESTVVSCCTEDSFLPYSHHG